MKAFCQRQDLQNKSVRFSFKENIIAPDQTSEQVIFFTFNILVENRKQ